MKFGTYLPTQHPAGSDYVQRFQELKELVLMSEKHGFDSVWVGEHHGGRDAFFPPFETLAAAAALVKRMTIGTAILVLPLYNTVHVAEAAAMLDVASGGKFVLGVGVGYRKEEYEAFSVPFKDRTEIIEEQIPLLRRIWKEKSTTYRGKKFHLRGVEINPKPLQDQVPVWMGASGAATGRALERIARLADGWLLDAATPLSVFKARLPDYLALLKDNGKPTAGVDLPMLRDVSLTESGESPRRKQEEAIVEKYRAYHRWGYPVVRRTFRREEDISFDALKEDVVIAGDPDQCIEQISRYGQAGVSH